MARQDSRLASPENVRQFSSKPLNHAWVTVVSPLNQRLVLQACDHCGVVKSENSIVRACSGHRLNRILTDRSPSNFSHAV